MTPVHRTTCAVHRRHFRSPAEEKTRVMFLPMMRGGKYRTRAAAVRCCPHCPRRCARASVWRSRTNSRRSCPSTVALSMRIVACQGKEMHYHAARSYGGGCFIGDTDWTGSVPAMRGGVCPGAHTGGDDACGRRDRVGVADGVDAGAVGDRLRHGDCVDIARVGAHVEHELQRCMPNPRPSRASAPPSNRSRGPMPASNSTRLISPR